MKTKKKLLTPEAAEKLLVRRINKYLKAGGSLDNGTWGELGLDADHEQIVLKDGPTCAFGAALCGMSGTKFVDENGYLADDDYDKMAAALFGISPKGVDRIICGFDNGDMGNSKSKWRRVGVNLYNKYKTRLASYEPEEMPF